jgi:hypothetical protein
MLVVSFRLRNTKLLFMPQTSFIFQSPVRENELRFAAAETEVTGLLFWFLIVTAHRK